MMATETISLYLDLEDGKKADLEAIARASLAFAEAARAIAGFIDPFSDVSLELVDVTEGSLSLNTKIKFKAGGSTYEITLRSLVLVFLAYLGTHLGEYLFEKATDLIWAKAAGEKAVSLSEEDKADIVNRAMAAFEAKAGEQQIKRLYAELDQDPAISGVGISEIPGARPQTIVPRSEFRRRSGVVKVEEPAERKRKNRDIVDAILVSPILANDRKRRWRFKVGDHEFGAPVRDHVFLDAVFSGKHPIIMKGNIHMRIALETQEEFIDGVWVPKDHIVWTVIGVPGQYQGPQTLLPFD